ncbi:MAG: helix-turn-helix domain-containing protein [Clostridia bacterium]|nr:helix-turn-helix domain-containing protein [Clostridia bacterium]
MQLSTAVRQRIIYLSKSRTNSLKSLSRASNVSYSTLVSFMVGKTRTLTLATLYDLCTGLDISLFDFFDDSIFNDVVDEHEKAINNYKK